MMNKQNLSKDNFLYLNWYLEWSLEFFYRFLVPGLLTGTEESGRVRQSIEMHGLQTMAWRHTKRFQSNDYSL